MCSYYLFVWFSSLSIKLTHLKRMYRLKLPLRLFWSYHLQWWMPAPRQDAQGNCHGQAKTMEAIEITCPVQLAKIQPTQKQRQHRRRWQCWDVPVVANLFRVLKDRMDSFHAEVPLFWQEANSSAFLCSPFRWISDRELLWFHTWSIRQEILLNLLKTCRFKRYGFLPRWSEICWWKQPSFVEFPTIGFCVALKRCSMDTCCNVFLFLHHI